MLEWITTHQYIFTAATAAAIWSAWKMIVRAERIRTLPDEIETFKKTLAAERAAERLAEKAEREALEKRLDDFEKREIGRQPQWEWILKKLGWSSPRHQAVRPEEENPPDRPERSGGWPAYVVLEQRRDGAAIDPFPSDRAPRTRRGRENSSDDDDELDPPFDDRDHRGPLRGGGGGRHRR